MLGPIPGSEPQLIWVMRLCLNLNHISFRRLIFWEILSFGILFFLLYKYAFPELVGHAGRAREKD